MEKLKAKWESPPKWQKTMILFLLPIAIMAYFYMMIISPMQEELKKAKKEKEQILIDIENQRRLTNPKVLDPLKKKKEELEAELIQKRLELERVVGDLPSERDMGAIYRKLGLIAKRHGVSILSVSLAKPTETAYDIEKLQDGTVIVKVVGADQQQQSQPTGQPQQQSQPQQQQAGPSTAVKHPTAELRLSFVGSYSQIINFLRSLEQEGIVSYPSSLRIDGSEANRLRGELSIFVVMKEEKL